MKYDYLKDIPANRRPKLVALWGKEYFASPIFLIMLFLASTPGVVSAIYNAVIFNRWVWAVIGLAISELLVAMCFIAIRSGMVSSNWGTYFRDTEPFRYWIGISFIFFGYIFVIALLWFGKQ